MTNKGGSARNGNTSYESIETASELSRLCDELRDCDLIGLDTEFVSEDCYEPDLCLVQLSTESKIYLVDPKAIDDVQPLWEVLAEGDHETIVHSGREEFRFCTRATGKRLAGLFDIQIAAGFIGNEYPAAYSTLVNRMLDVSLDKGETRTNWRTRPLSNSQIRYAAQDVVHLLLLRRRLHAALEDAGRLDWFRHEMEAWQSETELGDSGERWRRISGSASLSRRGLAILHSLWNWREDLASQRNRPARRVLRDDLMVEMARRETSDMRRIRSVRGFERSDIKKHLNVFSKLIDEALKIPPEQCPKRMESKGSGPQMRLLGQYLVAAAGCFCRDANIAASLVGTAQDYRDYAAYRLNFNNKHDDLPKLTLGWRRELIAPMMDDLLAGRLALRIDDPTDDQPLCLEPLPKRVDPGPQ